MEKTNKAKKPSWFKELKAEFNRIIWPTKERIAKETAVVVICAIIIGVIVAVLDVGIQYGADLDQVVIADAVGRLKSLHHKLLHNGGIQPCGTQSDVDF